MVISPSMLVSYPRFKLQHRYQIPVSYCVKYRVEHNSTINFSNPSEVLELKENVKEKFQLLLDIALW